MTTTRTPPRGPAPGIDAELKSRLRRLKLGRILDTLPERLALARADALPHSDFLSLILADEVERRDRSSAELRARAARLDPSMRVETFSSDTGAHFDRQLWTELCSLRFVDDARGALVLGPVGVGKTHLATALGHIAVRRRRTVAFYRADQLFRRLKAARLDNTHEAEMRRLARLDLLIIDDLALQAMDPFETTDFYDYAEPRIMPTGHPIGFVRQGVCGGVVGIVRGRRGRRAACPGGGIGRGRCREGRCGRALVV